MIKSNSSDSVMFKPAFGRWKSIIFIMILPFVIVSCFKEDEKLPPLPPPPAGVVFDTAAMTPFYKNQIFYDFGTGNTVETILKTDWDLGFSCDTTGVRIILNTSNFMKIADANGQAFGAVIDTSGFDWRFDKSDGNPDSAAILNWLNISGSDTLYSGHTFVVDRGMDEQGNLRGMRQLVFDSLKGNTYYFRFSNYNGSGIKSFSITKQAGVNYTYFSFAGSGLAKPLEPPKESWDIQFTQYTTLLYTAEGAAYPYLVTGVLLNPYKVKSAVEPVKSFESITLIDAESLQFSSALDGIGYDWKYYSFETGNYTVVTNKTFIIRDFEGSYFKLRFVSFYNQLGEKGYPVFEFQKL